MTPFKLRAKAKYDLKEIALYTENKWGREQRNLYLKQFDDLFRTLADSSSMGKECDFIKKGYKKFPQGSHIIFYKNGSVSSIEIIRILHKNMDIDSKFIRS